MARNRRFIIDNLEITDIAAEGKALGRYNDMVVFVPYVVPGDRVRVEVYAKKKNYAEARLLEVITPSPTRAEPFCTHFGTCGGCKWQVLPYDQQLFYKEKQVTEAFRRIAKVPVSQFLPILGSPLQIGYRNKLEFTFSNNRWLSLDEIQSGKAFDHRNTLGFHIPGMFDKVLEIDHCHFQPEPSNAIRNGLRAFAWEQGFTFFDIKQQHGLLRNLIVRNNLAGEFMVIVSFFEDDTAAIAAVMNYLASTFPQIVSLWYVINRKGNVVISDQELVLWSGVDHIIERMGDLKFRVSPKSFYQTNSVQALNLYRKVKELAGLSGGEVVYDLYTGTGTIANYVANQAKRVIGIEYVEDAIADARLNATLNNNNHCHFFAGDLKNVLTQEFVVQHGKPDVIITDPPRSGMHEDVVRTILDVSPGRIVYVSCNPATQARDVAMMAEKYSIEIVQPVDMFPQTHHVESVALLVRK